MRRVPLPTSVLYSFGVIVLVAGIVTAVVFLTKNKKQE